MRGGFVGIVNMVAAGTLGDLLVKVETADEKAAAAVTAAANARQMVLNRDPQISAATAAVNSLPITLQQAAAEHVTLQANIDTEKTARIAADDALAARLTALEARTLTDQVAQATTTVAVLLNATGSLTFTWPTAWPDVNYQPVLVSPLRVTNVTYAKTTTTCTVTYKAGVAVAIGALFNLAAVRLG